MIDASSLGLRRTLGPTAWLVFEELLLCSTDGSRACLAVVSVRSLASSLGLAKGTVARALGRIHAAGLVTGEQRRADTGVFAAGSYRIVVPGSVRPLPSPSSSSPSSSSPPSLPSSPPSQSVAPPRVARRPAPVSRRASAAQLALVFEA